MQLFFSDLLEKNTKEFPLILILVHFTKHSYRIFFSWKSFVKIFPNLKLEIKFHSHKKVAGFILQRIPLEIFFTWISFLKIFQNLKLEIEFHSHKKVVSPKLKNCAHLFIVNFKCAEFQQNQRTFLWAVDREIRSS